MNRQEAGRLGGLARAQKLSAERRREIAAMGFAALVDKRFAGDRQACVDWLVARGLAAQDACLRSGLQSLGAIGAIVPLAPDPGPMPPAPAEVEEPDQEEEEEELPF